MMEESEVCEEIPLREDVQGDLKLFQVVLTNLRGFTMEVLAM